MICSVVPIDPAEHLGLAYHIANWFTRGSMHWLCEPDKRDLEAEALLNLCLAADRYRSGTGATFATFAYSYIKGGVRNWLRSEGRRGHVRSWSHYGEASDVQGAPVEHVTAHARDPGHPRPVPPPSAYCQCGKLLARHCDVGHASDHPNLALCRSCARQRERCKARGWGQGACARCGKVLHVARRASKRNRASVPGCACPQGPALTLEELRREATP